MLVSTLVATVGCGQGALLDGVPDEDLTNCREADGHAAVSREEAEAEAIENATIPPALIERLRGDVVRDAVLVTCQSEHSPGELLWFVSFKDEVAAVQWGSHSCDVGDDDCEPGVPHVHEIDYVLIGVDASTGKLKIRADGGTSSLTDWVPFDEWELRWGSIVGVDYDTGEPLRSGE